MTTPNNSLKSPQLTTARRNPDPAAQPSLLGRIISRVSNIITSPYTILGLLLASPAAWILSGGNGGSNNLNIFRRDNGATNDTLILPASDLRNNSINGTLNNATQNTGPPRAIPMDLTAILAAAGHLENTTETDATLPVSLSFLDTDCEDFVLDILFGDESEETADTTSGPDTIGNLDNAESTDNTERTDRDANRDSGAASSLDEEVARRMIWRSNMTGINISQLRLNLTELQVAMGITIENPSNCIINMHIDTTSLPENIKAQQQSQAEGDDIDTALNSDSVNCAQVPDIILEGRNIRGEQTLKATLNVCQERAQKEKKTREKRDLDEASSSQSPTSAPDATNASENAIQPINATQVNNTSRIVNETEIRELIHDIRAQLCSRNITLITPEPPQNATGMNNSSTNTNSFAFNFTNQVVLEINQLCPNLTIYQIPAGDPSRGDLTTFSFIRGLDSFASNISSSEILVLDTSARSRQLPQDLTQLAQVVSVLNRLGIQIFPLDSSSWVGDIAGVQTGLSLSSILTLSSPLVLGPEVPLAAASYFGFLFGSLIILIPLSACALAKKRLNSRKMNISGKSNPKPDIEAVKLTRYKAFKMTNLRPEPDKIPLLTLDIEEEEALSEDLQGDHKSSTQTLNMPWVDEQDDHDGLGRLDRHHRPSNSHNETVLDTAQAVALAVGKRKEKRKNTEEEKRKLPSPTRSSKSDGIEMRIWQKPKMPRESEPNEQDGSNRRDRAQSFSQSSSQFGSKTTLDSDQTTSSALEKAPFVPLSSPPSESSDSD